MTPEQLEREAADRVRRMGYPDELSDAERWHCFREDAELVAASNDVLWERVRDLSNRLADTETEKIERGTEIIRLWERVHELERRVAVLDSPHLCDAIQAITNLNQNDVGLALKAVRLAMDMAQAGHEAGIAALAGGSDG